MKSIRVFAPATVANVACGFDVLGFALDAPGDELELRLTDKPGITITNHIIGLDVPTDPARNTAAVALEAYLLHLDSKQGFEIIFHEKIFPGSGLGSSAASAAAAVFAANELLGRPVAKHNLVQFAMIGEGVASGAIHADNVAPSLLGGFTLIRGYSPLDVVSLPYPSELFAAIAHPFIEVKTSVARSILKKEVPLKDAVTQWGNLAGLIAGLTTNNYELIGRSLHDVIAEPVRSSLIPGFYEVQNEALYAGALGSSISGAGPSVFALCKGEETAGKAGAAMGQVFKRLHIPHQVYVSHINPHGPRVL